MTTWAARLGLGLLAAGAMLFAGGSSAAASGVAAHPAAAAPELPAHPLGNATTNQYVGVRVEPDRLVLDYVLDLAELPDYQFAVPRSGPQVADRRYARRTTMRHW